MNKLNIILLAGGKLETTYSEGEYPDYLAEADGVPLIQRLIDNCASLNPDRITCIISEQEVVRFHLRNMIQQMHPVAGVHAVHDTTQGAACTALLASAKIDNEDELVLLSTNELLDVSLQTVVQQFRENGHDAGVVIFKALHPRYSFVRLSEEALVVEAAEKNPISTHAIAGMYWFKHGSMFVSAVKNMIRNDAKVNNVFYISPALNELVLGHRKIGTYRVEPHQYKPLKSHLQIQAFEAGAAR